LLAWVSVFMLFDFVVLTIMNGVGYVVA